MAKRKMSGPSLVSPTGWERHGHGNYKQIGNEDGSMETGFAVRVELVEKTFSAQEGTKSG